VASKQSGVRKAVYLLVVLAVAYLLFFYNLGSYSLKEPDEGRYAEIPREMVEQGDYIVPRLDYVRYFEKPPLLYWACAGSYRIFGVSEWSFRLPNAVSALLCILATWFFAASLFSAEAGFLSALILTTSLGFFGMARIATIDMLFSFLLSAVIFSIDAFYRTGMRRFLYLLSAALALAVLAKGPVALVLPAVALALFLLWERRFSFLKELASWQALLFFAAIAVPWFVLICVREREFFRFFFIDQNILRFVTTKHHRSGPLYYFFPVLFGGLFPWSVFIPRAVVYFWDRKDLRLLFIWCAVVFVFFSFSGSKLPPYILPLFPALSVILGCLIAEMRRERIQPGGEAIVFAFFFALVAVAGLAVLHGRADALLSDVTGSASLPDGLISLSLWMLAASLLALAVLTSEGARGHTGLCVLLAAFSLAVCAGLMVHVRLIDRLDTTKELALAVRQVQKGDAAVVNYAAFDETLPFYLGRRVYLADYKGELEMGSKYPDSEGTFLGQEAFLQLFRSERPVLVVFKERRIDRLRGLGIEESPVLCRAGRCLIANRSASAASPPGR
jgi:4-amino-4-deoxy-L-arabinose transferase-like glycosyltransferase